MPAFQFKAMTAAGAIVRITVDAQSEREAIQRLRADGSFPLLTAKHGIAFDLSFLKRFSRKAGSQQLALATQELASLLSAGVELDQALAILLQSKETGALHAAFSSARARLRDGGSFADALGDDGQFSAFYVSMVRSGEAGGSLETTLAHLAAYLERSQAIREAITSALVYPAMLLVAGGLSVAVILFFVLPQFEPLFADSGREMPLAAKIALTVSEALRGYWWLIIALIGGACTWFYRALQRPAFRRVADQWLLRAPIFGELLYALEIERFMRSVGTSLRNGLSLPASLGLAKDVLWNTRIADAVFAAAGGLREGERLSTYLGQTGVFDASTLDLIRIGEETGKLDEMLLRRADIGEKRVRHRVDRLLAMLVPALTILLGVLVGGLIASMLSAIMSVNDLVLQ